jgi:transcriptional regulator with XRE-family HTH domain
MLAVRLSAEKIKRLCQARDWQLGDLLEEARVSRTAYYHLIRKDSVLPRSVRALAAALGVSPARLLDAEAPEARRARHLVLRLEAIVAAHPEIDRDNVWHTLVLLEEPPVDRLNRGLLRGRAVAVH